MSAVVAGTGTGAAALLRLAAGGGPVVRTSCRGAVTSYKTHQAQLSLLSDKRTNYKNAGAFFPGQRGG